MPECSLPILAAGYNVHLEILLSGDCMQQPNALAILGASMTCDAVLNVGDTLLAMLPFHSRRLVRMTAKAGEAVQVSANVAGNAGDVVLSVEHEETAVIEIAGRPVCR